MSSTTFQEKDNHALVLLIIQRIPVASKIDVVYFVTSVRKKLDQIQISNESGY